jgi:PAS domain S-box-containing protein
MTQQRLRPLQEPRSEREAALLEEIAALRAEVEHLRGSESSLREAEDRYREIAEQSSDLISRHRADGVFMYASPAANAILGYQPHELIGLAVHDLIHPEDWDAALTTFNESRDAGAPHATVMCRLRRKHGRYIWVESTDRFVHDPVTGEVTLFHAVTRDVSKRKAVEDALRASEERYRELAEQSQDLISWHGPDATFLYASPAVRSLLGYEPEELIGHLPREFVHPHDVPIVLANLEAAANGAPAMAISCRIGHKDGRYIWFESVSRVLHDANGRVVGFQSVTRDISARKAVEDALRTSEERYRAIAEQSHDLISRHATDGTFTYASSASRALLGYEPGEMVGQPPSKFVHPDDLPLVRKAVEGAIASGQPSMVECRMRHRDGHYIWFESIDRAMYDDHGVMSGFHSVTRDITARRAAEDKLRASEERFRQVFELSRVGVAFVGEDRRFLRVNRALCEMVEYSEDELLLRTFLDLTHPDDVEVSGRRMDEVYSGQPDVGVDKRYITKSGRIIWVRVNATLMPGGQYADDDARRYNLAIIEEITQHKEVEAELRRLATLKSEFLALASHELRAPLTNISGGLEVIGDDAALLPAASRRAIEIVSSETKRLNRLVEAILDISRLDAGQLPLVLGPVAVEPLLKRLAAAAEFAERIDVWVAYGLPPAWADEIYLEHIIRNVLTNAAKYTCERITVTATGDHHRLLITVQDRGPGIAVHEQRHVFDPFFRSSRTDRGVAGYGLGLYFSRRMIEAQGGSIGVRSPATDDDSAPGTAFDIALPAAPEVD